VKARVNASRPVSYASQPGQKPANQEQSDEESSDGEVVGPLPPGASAALDKAHAIEVERRAERMKRKLLGLDQSSGPPEREEWMLELPELKRKNFGLGPRTFERTAKPEIKGRDQWTSTPGSEKKPQKEDEDETNSLQEEAARAIEERRNKELEKIVSKHDEKRRSKTLLKSHQEERKKKKKAEEAKPYERKPFDRDVDLKANQFDDAKRKALIKKSRELDTRFKAGGQKFL